VKEVKVSVAALDRARPPFKGDSESAPEVALSELFEGTATVEIPGYEQRQALRLANVYPGKQGEGEEALKKMFEYQGGLVKLAKEKLKGVELKIKSQEGAAISSAEELEQFEVAGRFFEAVACVVMKGVPLGNG
jgi:hypothetical protein